MRHEHQVKLCVVPTQLRKIKYNNIIMAMFSRSKRIRFYAVKGILKRVKCINIYTSWCRTYIVGSRYELHTGHLCSEIRNVCNDNILLYYYLHKSSIRVYIRGDAIFYNTQTLEQHILLLYCIYLHKTVQKRISDRIK